MRKLQEFWIQIMISNTVKSNKIKKIWVSNFFFKLQFEKLFIHRNPQERQLLSLGYTLCIEFLKITT